MGESTAVNSKVSSNKPTSQLHPLRLGIDVPLLLAVAFLFGFGLLMVYSASWMPAIMADKPANAFFLNQIKWGFVGLIGATIAMYFDYRRLKRLVVPIMLVTLILLVLVATIGELRFNARRTLFNGSIQPSELAKVVVVIYLAFWLDSKKDVLNKLEFGLFPMVTILSIISVLIFFQPDFSAILTIMVLGGLLFFLAGVDWRQIILILTIVLVLGLAVVLLTDTGRARIDNYVEGFQNPENASYQLQRSLESVVRGGIFGVGIGKGTTKFTGLPVSHTDSIFAVIAEETGLIGATVVVLMYMVILWRGLKIASRARDLVGKLIAAGLTIWIILEAFINIGVMVQLVPVAGNALPLISSGGSNLTMTLGALGLIMSVSRVSSHENEIQEGRSFGAVVNLRRGNRRRRVSRPDRSSGSWE